MDEQIKKKIERLIFKYKQIKDTKEQNNPELHKKTISKEYETAQNIQQMCKSKVQLSSIKMRKESVYIMFLLTTA